MSRFRFEIETLRVGRRDVKHCFIVLEQKNENNSLYLVQIEPTKAEFTVKRYFPILLYKQYTNKNQKHNIRFWNIKRETMRYKDYLVGTIFDRFAAGTPLFC